jgi:3-(3-hydroxy-phenyl)propionate hydroxylase
LTYLSQLGIVDQLIELGIKAPIFQLRERSGEIVASFDLTELADVTSFPFRLQCEQNKLCRILQRELEDSTLADLQFSTRVKSVKINSDHVELIDSNEIVRQFDFVIAADGAHSQTRSTLGIGLEGITYPERFLIASTSTDITQLIPDLAHVSYIADPQEWAALIHSPDHWRVMFPIIGEDDEEALIHPAMVNRRLQNFFEVDSTFTFPLHDVTVYNVHRRVARSWSAGRVFLVGDAAHLNNPLGGQGMNSGIHDAVTLARSLDRVISHGRPESDLEHWAERRNLVAKEYVGGDTNANYAALREPDANVRAKYRQELKAILSDQDRRRGFLIRSAMLNTATIGHPEET